MQFNHNIALVNTLFTPKNGGLVGVTEPSRFNQDRVPGAQIQVVRWCHEAQDLIYQTFAIGWRHPGTSRADNRMSFRGWAKPGHLIAGAKLTSWALAQKAEEKICSRLNAAMRANLPEIKGEVPVEASLAKPMAYHPQGLVEYQDFLGRSQVLITKAIPGAEAFSGMVPEDLREQNWTLLEALETCTVENTKVDMTGLGSWIAVQADSLRNTQAGIDMLLGLRDCEEIHRAYLARVEASRHKRERLARARSEQQARAAAADKAIEKAAEQVIEQEQPAPTASAEELAQQTEG